tara:strand:+ start:8436 stop:8690 length:255 start_codon:yes stop_codon:yes gene_type:complete
VGVFPALARARRRAQGTGGKPDDKPATTAGQDDTSLLPQNRQPQKSAPEINRPDKRNGGQESNPRQEIGREIGSNKPDKKLDLN